MLTHTHPSEELIHSSLRWSLGTGEPGLVSVIVPAYNQSWVIRETLASVAAQTYRPLECIIVDDGSTDPTGVMVEDFASERREDLRVFVIHQKNTGLQGARNNGTLRSRGEFIQYLDGDDRLYPSKIAEHVAFLCSAAGDDTDVVYGDATFLFHDRDGERIGQRFGLGATSDFLAALLDFSRFNVPFSYLFRRSAIERCGMWDRSLRFNEDVDYLLRLACLGARFRHLPINDGLYRIHQRPRISTQSMSIKVQAVFRILTATERRLRISGLSTPERRRALAYAFYTVSCWASGTDNGLWQRSLAHALRLDPGVQASRPFFGILRKVLGVWQAEWILREARTWKILLNKTIDAVRA